MYLSKLLLDPLNRKVRKDLGDCHSMHRRILQAFPPINNQGKKPRDYYKLLYRVEQNKDGHIVLYVQSKIKPDWDIFGENYLLSSFEENPACKNIEENINSLKKGIKLSFCLRANPTKKVETSLKFEKEKGRKNNGRRIFLQKEEEQQEWLERKAEQNGFELLQVKNVPDVLDLNINSGNRAFGKTPKNKKLIFGAAVYQGHLLIRDREKFIIAVKNGIGSAKAFGFGLISLAPTR